ncbi:hypothetical protein B0F90DRAFT_1198930 [Multifurca ochricompacta]|uniref:SUZ domain-containing protein n=1 Tax=Multifurca ochricompacta TaxID=376703 RepID=A0AAD4M8R3_9AGAM|nr:hypothetical protein B0F90DRAFT_1198930 [Multifurca ochricompacta]
MDHLVDDDEVANGISSASSSEEEDNNQKIWDNANKKPPMPQLIVTSSKTGSTSSVVPPASAFQSPIRILKRSLAPTPNTGSSAHSTTRTYAERSAQYSAARERIFSGATQNIVGAKDRSAISAIVRNPKGPEHAEGPNKQGGEGSQGFAARSRSRAGQPSDSEKQVSNCTPPERLG